MKTPVESLKYLALAVLVLFTTACSNDDDEPTTPPQQEFTITELAASNADLSSLVAALQQTGLDEVLDNPGDYTVLAPTNAAFSAFLGGTAVADVPTDVLANVLLNHVLNQRVASADFATGYRSTLGTGPDDNVLSLYVNTTSGIEFNGVASPVAGSFDVEASNGIIHVVDAVIAPPTVVDHAVANDTFSELVAALSRFDSELIDILNGDGPFTVFAPTNDAFQDLYDALGVASVDEIDIDVLRTVLTYHVVGGANVQSTELTDGQTITTVSTEDLTVDLSTGAQLIDGSGFPTNIIATDVQGINGVVHAVDRVLLPPSVVEAILANATIYDFAKFSPDYSILAAAVDRAGLAETLDDPNAGVTVFAPDNAAFAAFLEANGIATLEDVPVELLTNILLNHVIAGEVGSGDLSTSYTNTLATNADGDALSLYVSVDGGVSLNGVSNVVFPDVAASNGIIHAVDAVIGLPTIVTFATADPTFETLVAALTREESFTFVDLLSDTENELAPFTVFAPTNDAFGDLLTETGFPTLADIPTELLETTLFTHVLAQTNTRAEDLSGSATVATASTEEITIDVISDTEVTITDPNGRVSNIIATNVQAINGVIHAIDTVILPTL